MALALGMWLLFVTPGLWAAEVPVVRFTVERFEIVGDNPLADGDADSILANLAGEFEGVDGLLAVAEALTAGLAERGYTFYRVTLPPQTLKDGVVQLKIIAFTLGEISVAENTHFSDDNVRAALPALVSGAVPSPPEIARDLELANRHPAKQIGIRLKESSAGDQVDAILTVKDRRPWQVFANLNDTGTRESGRSRISVGAQYSNLFNLDHSLTLSYTTSPENADDVRQYGFAYNAPLHRFNGALSAFYTKSDVDSGQIDDFEVSGAGEFWGLSFNQLLLKRGNYAHEWWVGFQDRLFENDTNFLSLLGIIPLGVDVRSRPFTLGYAASYRRGKAQMGFNISYVRNWSSGAKNDKPHYRIARFGADPDWGAFRFATHADYFLPGGWLLRGVVDGQYTDESLISGEQFGVGGVRSVRGFDERESANDRGVHGSLELWTAPLPKLANVRFLGFFDVGFVDAYDPLPGEVDGDTLSSVGAGARWQWHDQFSVSVDYGFGIADAKNPDPRKGDKDGGRWHFSIFYRY